MKAERLSDIQIILAQNFSGRRYWFLERLFKCVDSTAVMHAIVFLFLVAIFNIPCDTRNLRFFCWLLLKVQSAPLSLIVRFLCRGDPKCVVAILLVGCKGWLCQSAWFASKSSARPSNWCCDWCSSDRHEAAGSVTTSVFLFEVGWIHQPLHPLNGWSFQALIRIAAQLL